MSQSESSIFTSLHKNLKIKTMKIKIVPVDSHGYVSLSQSNSGCWITGCSGEYFEVKKNYKMRSIIIYTLHQIL